MTSNPQTSVRPYRHYLYDDATKTIWYSTEMPENRPDLIYLGESNNPKIKAAAAYYIQHGKVSEGYTLKNLDD